MILREATELLSKEISNKREVFWIRIIEENWRYVID
jgi:hypothetical protein